MRTVLASLSAMMLATATPQMSAADVLVELFTSQGCSSCPPADALLGELKARDGVIALSLHVDYWDYLGWKDEFADAAFSDRQRRYAAAAGATMIYTPQMVIGGADHIVGTRGMELSEQITRHKAVAKAVELAAQRKGDTVTITAMPKGAVSKAMVVQLVRYAPEKTVSIKRGENAGRKITYHNVVMSWAVVGEWDGAAPLTLDAQAQGDAPAVVIVQDGAAGPILAAAKVD